VSFLDPLLIVDIAHGCDGDGGGGGGDIVGGGSCSRTLQWM
jgi:hypothetical protein